VRSFNTPPFTHHKGLLVHCNTLKRRVRGHHLISLEHKLGNVHRRFSRLQRKPVAKKGVIEKMDEIVWGGNTPNSTTQIQIPGDLSLKMAHVLFGSLHRWAAEPITRGGHWAQKNNLPSISDAFLSWCRKYWKNHWSNGMPPSIVQAPLLCDRPLHPTSCLRNPKKNEAKKGKM